MLQPGETAPRAAPLRRPNAAGRRLSLLQSLLLALAAPLAGLLLAFVPVPLVDQLRNLVFDHYQWADRRPWTPDLPVRVVDIDDESLSKLGQWPWPRDRLADLATKLHAMGAAAVAFDITFSEPDRVSAETFVKHLPEGPLRQQVLAALPSTDSIFATAVASSRHVLAFFLNDQTGAGTIVAKGGFAHAGDDPRPFLPRFSRVVAPLDTLSRAAAGLGAINFMPDRDLVVRKIPLVFGLGADRRSEELVPSFDAELLRVAQSASTIIVKSSNASGEAGFGAKTGVVTVKIGDLEIPTEWDGSVRIRYAGFQKERRIAAWRLLADKVAKEQIANRIVIVSSSAAALSDLRSTPIEGAVPGGEIHAELLEHVLSGQRLARPDYAPGLEAFAIVLGGLAVSFVARRLAPLPAAVFTAVLVAGAAIGSFMAFRHLALLIDPLLPGMTWLAAYGLTTVVAFRRSDRERKFVRGAFSRYLAPAVVERLARDPSLLRLGGERRKVTVLFADARDFTRRSEGRTAEGVVGFLNRLMTPLTAAVLDQGGTLDKYIGDGLMAFWNAPLDVDDHANRACRAALAMQAAVPGIDALEQAAAAAEGCRAMPVRVGVGLNTGEVFVGNMGSEMRFDYSIVGDPVNLAARLEAATKTLGVPVVVSETTAAAATGFRFVDLGTVALAGKSGLTRVFALHGAKAVVEDFDRFVALHAEALTAAGQTGGDLREAIARARAHPLGERYAEFYERLARRPVDAAVAAGPKLGL